MALATSSVFQHIRLRIVIIRLCIRNYKLFFILITSEIQANK